MEESDNIKPSKPIIKKKKHYFEVFISKVLKEVSEKCNITANAKQQLNSFLCILSKKICSLAFELTIFSKKKTISEKEVSNAIKMILIDGLLKNSIIEGEKAIKNFKDSEVFGSRKNKAGILFSPSISEKFLRNFGHSKIMITSLAPIYLSAVLEYLTYEILDLSCNYVQNDKRVRITIRDIEVSVRNDVELDKLFNSLNISFLGGGVIPYIHPSLTKKRKKKYNIKSEKSKYRYRPGTIALKNIKKHQKLSDSLIFSKSSFEKFVRLIFKENKENNEIEQLKISKEVFIIIQYFIEQFVVKILYNANFLAIHANRVKLLPIDIAFISYLINNSKNPYSSFINETGDILSIDLHNEYNTEVIDEDLSSNNSENNNID
jgi:histone H2A